VILWPDTFNNQFFLDVPKAALEVLEAAGYKVMIPERSPLGALETTAFGSS